jgi:hypothetical protein
MNNKSWPSQGVKIAFKEWSNLAAVILAVCSGACPMSPGLASADAPAWLHAVANVPVPEHDDKTDAVLLLSEDVLTVQPNGRMKRLTRRAYKILRVKGRGYGVAQADFDAETKGSMFGALKPIIPMLYALMSVSPTSAPKITRMFGVLT